jgi:hypothetical protein
MLSLCKEGFTMFASNDSKYAPSLLDQQEPQRNRLTKGGTEVKIAIRNPAQLLEKSKDIEDTVDQDSALLQDSAPLQKSAPHKKPASPKKSALLQDSAVLQESMLLQKSAPPKKSTLPHFGAIQRLNNHLRLD